MRFNSISELISSSFFNVVMDLSVHKYNVKQTKKRIINPLADYGKIGRTRVCLQFLSVKKTIQLIGAGVRDSCLKKSKGDPSGAKNARGERLPGSKISPKNNS
jgi:hypothetical protein